MGKFSDKCKRYVGMTALAALCTFGGANKAEAKQANNEMYNVTTQTFMEEATDYNITDSTYTHSYTASMLVQDGRRTDEMYFRSINQIRDLGDGYMYVSKEDGRIKNGQMKRKSFDYQQYMVTPDGNRLDCSFFDSGQFMVPEIIHVKEDGSQEVETHSMDEVRTHNMKMEIKFKQEARKKGFSEEDVKHFAKIIKDTRRGFENGDIGRVTDHYIKSETTHHYSSYNTNVKKSFKEEKKQATADFRDFIKNQGRNL